MHLLPTRMRAWLCLALTLLGVLTPAHGFVVCVEADGCVNIEVASAAPDCGNCTEHESGASTSSECPCVDYVVPGVPDEPAIAQRAADLQIDAWFAPRADVHVFQPLVATTSVRGPPPKVPRVAQSLTHIRTVILLT